MTSLLTPRVAGAIPHAGPNASKLKGLSLQTNWMGGWSGDPSSGAAQTGGISMSATAAMQMTLLAFFLIRLWMPGRL
jgi:hypothetical protein